MVWEKSFKVIFFIFLLFLLFKILDMASGININNIETESCENNISELISCKNLLKECNEKIQKLAWVENLSKLQTYSGLSPIVKNNVGKTVTIDFGENVYVNPFFISGTSMLPTLDTNDIIIVHRPRSEDEIKIGTIIVADVCWARMNEICVGRTITMHRVWEIKYKDGKKIYYTKGDSELEKDWWWTKFDDILYIVDGVIYR